MLVRRSLLAQLEGFDERFFLYAEDVDLCRRIRDAGYDILFEPNAVARHAGGASAPKAATLPLLARSQALYVRKHFSRPVAVVYRFGYALGYLSHLMVARGGLGRRSGYARALRQVAIG
jgi:GT2 family glycosyltransferase